jgi:phosphoserine phosphatase RsbU/P
VQELQAALDTVKELSGLLPICSYCKRIRDDNDYWQQLESFVSEHTRAQFSHGICPACFEHAQREMGL